MNLPPLIGFFVNVGITAVVYYFLTTYRQRNPQRFNSAYRAILVIVLLFVFWLLIPHVRAYADMLMQQTRESRRITAQMHKVSAAQLQAEYIRARVFSPNAGLRCIPAEHDWDYICSFMPTPLKSKTRLEFGVIVDETRVLQTSRRVPEGTTLPSPQ